MLVDLGSGGGEDYLDPAFSFGAARADQRIVVDTERRHYMRAHDRAARFIDIGTDRGEQAEGGIELDDTLRLVPVVGFDLLLPEREVWRIELRVPVGDPDLLRRGLEDLDLRITEPVDRLLLVADDTELAERKAIEQAIDDPVLQLVGILELVDHDMGESPLHPLERFGGIESFEQTELQILEVQSVHTALAIGIARDAVGVDIQQDTRIVVQDFVERWIATRLEEGGRALERCGDRLQQRLQKGKLVLRQIVRCLFRSPFLRHQDRVQLGGGGKDLVDRIGLSCPRQGIRSEPGRLRLHRVDK